MGGLIIHILKCLNPFTQWGFSDIEAPTRETPTMRLFPLSIVLDKPQHPTPQEKFRALHTEEAFNGLFDINIASKAPSRELRLQSEKQMKVTWCEIRTGGWCRRSQPREAIWFCIAVTEGVLALSSNRKPDLRNPGHFFQITSFNFYQGITIPRRLCGTLVPTSKKST
ncbi:hypothetical protein TNCV_4704891 [Trichonephila clavipes]|nr:hypothetical protein TNCV_4704891 [Trichonephila clavipes]